MTQLTAFAPPVRLGGAMRPFPGITVLDAIECMGAVFAGQSDDILLCSTVFPPAAIGPGDTHLLAAPGRRLPPDEELFSLARRGGAPGILFGSRSSGPIEELHEADIELTRRLVAGARRNSLIVVEHAVVAGNCFRLMSETGLLA